MTLWVDEVATGELAPFPAEERREALVVEIGEGLAGRELGRAPQPVDAALAAIACLDLEDLEQVWKQLAVTCRSELASAPSMSRSCRILELPAILATFA